MSVPLDYDGGLTLALSCGDRQASADWYRDRLGFRLLYDVEEIGWCEMATHIPNVNIGFAEVDEVEPRGAVPTFGVQDLDAARRALEEQGVRFDGPNIVHEGMVKLATFYDPDGNALMLYESLGEEG